MNREKAKEFNTFSYNGDMDYIKESSVSQRIDAIFDYFEDRSCNWHQEENIEDFEADCGMQFTLFEGMPSKNNMNFCPKCGKKLIEHKYIID